MPAARCSAAALAARGACCCCYRTLPLLPRAAGLLLLPRMPAAPRVAPRYGPAAAARCRVLLLLRRRARRCWRRNTPLAGGEIFNTFISTFSIFYISNFNICLHSFNILKAKY